MKNKNKLFPLNFSFVDLKFIIIISVICFYIGLFALNLINGTFISDIGDDHFGYWSVGKIADEAGYEKIYDLSYLRNYQVSELYKQGYLDNPSGVGFYPMPVPYFAFFLIPFQFLSRLPVLTSYWIWNFLNTILLVGYLIFFLTQTISDGNKVKDHIYLVILVIFSFSSISNFISGQINVLFVVCIGEFIRNAVSKKPLLSGLWLGGLLVKPQLLILIIPYLILTRGWKVLKGFSISSFVVLMVSLSLSGFSSFRALFDLLTKYSQGLARTAPDIMVNWRMVGIMIDSFFVISNGWIFTLIGIILTILFVVYLVNLRPSFGSSSWVVSMLGLFTATLAVSWHTHYHMTMALIPLLLYATLHHYLPEKYLLLWVALTPAIWLLSLTIVKILPFFKESFTDFSRSMMAVAGLIVNLIILVYVINNIKQIQEENV